MKHIQFEKLANYFEGVLSASDGQDVAGHLAGCAECAAQAQRLESFFSYVNNIKSEQVSQADTARLLNIFQPTKKPVRSAESFGKKLLAGLVFDDWQMAVNERFTATDTRNLLYSAGGVEIDLRLNFAGGKCQVSGQVFPDCGSRAVAEIISETISEKAVLNESCEFVFPAVKEAVYTFRLTFDEQVVEIENFSLIN